MACAAQSAPADLDLSTWGTHTRATEASYVIGTPTTGSTPFLGWAPKDTRRIQRRDGTTPMYLTERAMTNRVRSTEIFTSGWLVGGATRPSTLYPSPDGVAQSGRVQVASAGEGLNMALSPVTVSLDWCASAFHRAPSGTSAYQHMIGGSTITAVGGTASTTWERREARRRPDNTFGQLAFWLDDGRAFPGAAGARDSVIFGAQLEQSPYVTSYIRSVIFDGVNGCDRAADALSGLISSVPAKMVSGAWAFTVAPVGDSAGMVRLASTQTLFSFAEDGSETVEFYITGGACYLRVVSGGVARVTSSALTFTEHQTLTVTIDSVAGTLIVAGASTGNGTSTGTAWTRTPGTTLYIGARADGSNHADAGIWCGAPAPAVSAAKRVAFTLGQSNMSVNGMQDRTASNIQIMHPDTKLIDGSMGGTSLAVDWAKVGGTQYAAALARWAAAVAADPTLTGYTPIVFWVQGESDAANSGYAAAYGANLAALKTNIETDIPQLVGARWIVGQLPSTTTHIYGANATTIGQVRTAQAAFVAGLGSLGALVDPSDLALEPGDLHFTAASTYIYAARMGAAARSIGA